MRLTCYEQRLSDWVFKKLYVAYKKYILKENRKVENKKWEKRYIGHIPTQRTSV